MSVTSFEPGCSSLQARAMTLPHHKSKLRPVSSKRLQSIPTGRHDSLAQSCLHMGPGTWLMAMSGASPTSTHFVSLAAAFGTWPLGNARGCCKAMSGASPASPSVQTETPASLAPGMRPSSELDEVCGLCGSSIQMWLGGWRERVGLELGGT
eukprot:254546-Pelagomonas_calceolata.AAC.6